MDVFLLKHSVCVPLLADHFYVTAMLL